MVKVECDDCKSPYQIEERRIPATGLKMRCSKCGKSLLVQKPASGAIEDEDADLPAPVAPRPKPGPAPVLPRAAPPAAPKPTARAVPAKPAPPAPPKPTAPASPAARVAPPSAFEIDEDLDLPVVRPGDEARLAPSTSEDDMLAFGELDLPAPARPTVRRMAEPSHEPEPEEIDLPAPAKPTVRQMAAPVMPKDEDEIDLPAPARPAPRKVAPPPPQAAIEVDLPAPARPAPARPAPARPAPSKAAPEEIDLPAPTASSRAKGFGEIDLPAPAASSRAKGFGEIDLPASSRRGGSRGFGEIDLPAAPLRSSDSGAFGEIDLPEIESTAPTFGEIELPATDLSPPSSSFGDLDLPVPEPSSAPFGEIDLPLAPPSARSARNEIATPLASPQDDTALNFGELDLPLVGDEPPAPARPATTAGGSGEFRLEDEALDAAFGPTSPPAAKAPPSAKAPPAARYEESVGEEFSFGELAAPDMDLSTGATVPGAGKRPEPAPAPAMPAIPRAPAVPTGDMGAGIGDEVDLAPGEGGAPGEAAARKDKPAKQTSKEFGRTADLGKRKGRSRSRLYVVAAVTLLAVGGGSLALLPDIGPFGAHAISDRINAQAHAQALADLERSVQASLDEDTFTAATRALADARAAQTSRPRHRPTAAYAAYVAFMRSVRHGRRGDDETLGKQLLALAKEEPSPERALAVAAQQAAARQLDAARVSAKTLLDSSPDNLDAAVLLGEIELEAAGRQAPMAAWKRAAGIKKSARTLYGLARAQLQAGDAAGAQESARAALAASPKHAGAHVLLASLLGFDREAEHETEALALLAKVTGESEVRSATNDAQVVEAHVVVGRIHLGRSRISAAEKAFAAALQIDPRSVDALIGDGELLFQSGRFSQALLRFEEAMRADDASIRAKLSAAKAMLALERGKDAKELLTRVRADKPTDVHAAFLLGKTEGALGNAKEAERLYLESIQLAGDKPAAVDAYVALSSLLSTLGRGDEAQAKLAEAQTKFPDLPALYRAKGEVFLQTGRYAEARKEFEAALAKEDNLDTRFKLGITLRRMRAFDEAGAVFEKLAALDKDFPGLALERGLLFEEMGQSERALEMYADALKKAPNDVDLKLRVGSTQVIAGHPAQAEPILREVVKERPGSADANHFLGRALLLKGGQAPEAMRFLEQAINIDGNRAEYHLYVGWAANELGQTPRAEAALARALELDRELADAYWQRGVLLQKQGRTLDALADLQIALDKRPTRYEAYATMALCYQDQARWPDALAAWQKAVAGNGSVAEWHYRLGKIHDANGNRLAATPELEKAIELADVKGKPVPVWLFDAHFLFAEAMRASGGKDKAITSYRRYLELAPAGNAYRVDAERALQSLGAGPP
ncbi:zinc-ribbon domain-containing protein [Polyangium aurulentum]|nr:zinc-ribbon domain-containing protein [Polyangium aurulentum]